MKFDVFFSICQTEVDGYFPTERVMFENLFNPHLKRKVANANVSAAAKLDTVWQLTICSLIWKKSKS